MVDCSQFLEAYSEFRDGLLDPEQLRSYEAHLAICHSCARYDQVIGQGTRLVRELPEPEPSFDFMPRLQHRIYNLDEDRWRMHHGSSGASLGFILAIAVVIGLSAWAPALRPQPGVVELPAVVAHAPHRVEVVEVLLRPGPFLPAPSTAPSTPPGNALFFRYSPVGTHVATQPIPVSLPR